MNNELKLSKNTSLKLDAIREKALAEVDGHECEVLRFGWQHAVTFVLVVASLYWVIPSSKELSENQLYEEFVMLQDEDFEYLMDSEVVQHEGE